MNFLEGKDIWISPYRLKSKGFLNAISGRREFEGILIRVGNGYGCIHPWEELGDPPIKKCLEDLKGRRFWPIVRRALRCAEYDDSARNEEESLFEEMEVPRSHATLTSLDNSASLAKAIEAGFDTVKFKFGKNLDKEIEHLLQVSAEYPAIKWRLDFNEKLEVADAEYFLKSLPSSVTKKIDFLEDITPYSDAVWKRLWRENRVQLAVDQECGTKTGSAQVAVIKPAVDEPFLLCEAAIQNQQRAIFTSYMDHPLGQAFAAWEAARMSLIFPGLISTSGLQTHHLFEETAFTEKLGEWSPTFHSPGGTGLGFDNELAELPWIKLS